MHKEGCGWRCKLASYSLAAMENCISNWIQLLDKALERERWGQIVETKQCYETLVG